MRFLRKASDSGLTILLFSALLLLICGQAVAQKTSKETTNAPAATNTAATSSDSTTDATTNAPTTTTSNTNGGNKNTASTTDTQSTSVQTTTESTSLVTTEATSTSESSLSLPHLPTSDSTSTTGLPTLPSSSSNGGNGAASTTWVAPVISVPPTANAPYMQKSNLPEGTVFIAVGAALGVIGLSVLAWRAMVAWSINRSVRRAAEMQAAAETKILLAGGKRRRSSHHRRHSSHHRHRHHTSSVSMRDLNSVGQRQSSYPTLSKTPASQGSLFFSPTASAGMNQSTNRGSGYLPAGYYAAGSATPGGHNRHGNPSPPGSPHLPTSRGHDTPFGSRSSMAVGAGASNSTLSLNVPPHSSHGRAPSAYLEDLFSSHTPQPRSDQGYDR
jgi:hypothetical protein